MISTYYAWTEILPAAAQAISNFVVSPGDEIYTEVSIGDAGTAPSLGGQFGRFLISNLTKSVTTNVLTPLGGTVVPGGEAVWIVERPTVNGTLPPLANYGAIIMLNPQARQTDGQQVSYLGNNIVNTMEDDGGTVLSTPASTSDSVMLFIWKATS